MERESFWEGTVTALAFIQADHDTKENHDKGNRDSAIRVRLPYPTEDFGPKPKHLEEFGQAVSYLNEEATILHWRPAQDSPESNDYMIEFTSTEGYIGLPWEQRNEWRY